MRKIKKLFAGCLILVMFSTLYSPAFAANNSEDVAEVVLREVTSLYADIYSISDATATVSDVSVDDAGNKTFTVNASFHRTLKASSADEAPLIKELAVVAMQINDKSDLAAANSYITARKADIQRNYIGKPQDTNVELQVTLSSGMTAADISIDNIEYVGMVQNLPVTSISPNTGETLKLAAEYELEKAIASSVVSTIMVQKSNYDFEAGAEYARKYSCTSGSSQNHGCHNPAYTFTDNNDCANFVSQCYKAAGIPEDSNWYPYSTYWSTTGNNGAGLRQFLTGIGFTRKTSQSSAVVGSTVNWLNSSGRNLGHVGYIDQNDGSSATFCAHTKCRRSCPVGKENVDYYVPN